MTDPIPKLVQFYLNSNLLNSNSNFGRRHISADRVPILVESLQNNRSLYRLDLRNNPLGDQGILRLIPLLRSLPNLEILNLSYTQYGQTGAEILEEFLATNTTLGEVILSHNITISLIPVLRTNSTLTQVVLSWSNIDDEKAEEIAGALKLSFSLRVLWLYKNNIGDQGAQALAEALKVNRSLTELSLGSNQIGDSGAKAIGKALKINSTLIRLELCYNPISPEGYQTLNELLIFNFSCRHNSAVLSLRGLYQQATETYRMIRELLKQIDLPNELWLDIAARTEGVNPMILAEYLDKN